MTNGGRTPRQPPHDPHAVTWRDRPVRRQGRTLGYIVVRQRGSHIRLRHASDPSRKPLTIPDHRALKPGLLRHLTRDAEVDPEESRRLLNQ